MTDLNYGIGEFPQKWLENVRIADFGPAEIQRPVWEVKVERPQLFL